jgi:hypothetical protein
MATIIELKEQSITETPLLLFDCELATGAVERWSTNRVEVDGQTYEARVLRHDLFELRSGSDEGIDALARVSISLANADSHFSQIERNTGWKGGKVTIRFLFFDMKQGVAASESRVLFRGVADPPNEITESTFRLTATNSLNLQRRLAPEVRVQRRCPWKFPSNAAQRAEAVHGGAKGKHSPFFRCGYSPDISEGVGNRDGETPYPACDYTRAQCEQRGMFRQDSGGNPTRRFGGIEFVPSTTLVRSYGEKAYHLSSPVENEARYNDFVPLVYGTAWYSPLIVFSKNDGNLTRMEALLGMGEIQGVLKVLVNGMEIPPGHAGTNMTATGWYNAITLGNRTGNFNGDYLDAAENPLGDPYGSMAALSVVVPNRVNEGKTLPRIEVLVEGLRLSQYAVDGSYLGDSFTNNPAWVLLDLLQRNGWGREEIDVASFARAGAYCSESIQAYDLYGNPVWIPRFQCNLVLRKRRSVADAIRGVRNGSRLFLTYTAGGLLQLRVENPLALEQPTKPEGSNSTETLGGGWPCYEFGDGSTEHSGILRRENGEPSIRMWSRSTAETPNRVTVEFQDAFNEYQQDSLSLVDVEDVLAIGQEVSIALPVLGVPNFNQAARLAKFYLDKSIAGNTYIEFETSVRALGLKPGDLITVTYLKEGLQRQPFRILKISPGLNYRSAVITAQIHGDSWYADDNADGIGNSDTRRQPGSAIGLPRPLAGAVLDENGEPQLEIVEETADNADGGVDVRLAVGFVAPQHPAPAGAGIPLVSLAPRITATGGTLAGDQTLYYATSALDSNGGESALSFLMRATIPPGTNTNTVTLVNLSFSRNTTGFNVYRGSTPNQLFRIASNESVVNEFTDSGLPKELVVPPDENYDQANFYWRLELQPEYPATIHSATTIGNTTLTMPADRYRGMVVRITKGKGAGQERAVISNSDTTLTLASHWDIVPNAASLFVIAESGWHFGATGRTSPVEFQVPNREGATVHVSGRSANVQNAECAYELSPLTRWRISGAGTPQDGDVPPKPVFGIMPTGEGSVELVGISFEDLTNTRTIAGATLTLNYWDELSSPSQVSLNAAIGADDSFIDLTVAGTAQVGSLLQIDSELLRVEQVLNGGLRYQVQRAAHSTTATPHASQTPIYHLKKKVFVVPFVRDFFGSPSSGSFSYPIFLPDGRIASAELSVTNTRGNSETKTVTFTYTVDSGLRTLSGGQFSIQVEGYLAIQSNAAPPLVVQDSHSVRDIFAVVREAPTGAPVELRLRQNEVVHCNLTIPANSTVSNTVSGFGLPSLAAGAQINLDIVSVGQGADSLPGRDLTVTLRI